MFKFKTFFQKCRKQFKFSFFAFPTTVYVLYYIPVSKTFIFCAASLVSNISYDGIKFKMTIDKCCEQQKIKFNDQECTKKSHFMAFQKCFKLNFLLKKNLFSTECRLREKFYELKNYICLNKNWKVLLKFHCCFCDESKNILSDRIIDSCSSFCLTSYLFSSLVSRRSQNEIEDFHRVKVNNKNEFLGENYVYYFNNSDHATKRCNGDRNHYNLNRMGLNNEKNENHEIHDKLLINYEEGFSKIFDIIRPSIVQIYSFPFPSSSTSLIHPTFCGSGFIYNSQGFIVTAAHLFNNPLGNSSRNENFILKLSNGKTYIAKIIGLSQEADVAVLKILNDDHKIKFEFLPIDELKCVSPPKQGQFVLTYGATQHGDSTVAVMGVVSQPKQSFNQNEFNSSNFNQIRFIQIGMITLPGMSGAPVCDVRGNVVGIVVKKFHEYGLALPINFISKIVASIEKYGYWKRPSLGIIIRNNEDDLWNKCENISQLFKEDEKLKNHFFEIMKIHYTKASGLYVERVKENSLSEKAGIRKGDRIMSVNGINVSSHFDLFEEIVCNEMNSLIFKIFRENEVLQIIINLQQS